MDKIKLNNFNILSYKFLSLKTSLGNCFPNKECCCYLKTPGLLVQGFIFYLIVFG